MIKHTPTMQDIMYGYHLRILTEFALNRSNQKISDKVMEIRKYIQQLPATIRSHLLRLEEESVKSFESGTKYPVSLFFNEVLLSSGIKHVKVTFYPTTFLDELLHCLLANTKKLQTLEIDSYPYTYTEKSTILLTKLIVQNSDSLIELNLPNCANDELLHVLGDSCKQLKSLKLMHSPITDSGIEKLTQTWRCVTEDERIDEANRLVSHVCSSTEATCSVKKGCVFSEAQMHTCSYICFKTKLCKTLKNIVIDSALITVRGLMILLELVDSLDNIYQDLDKFLPAVYEKYLQNPDVIRLIKKWKPRNAVIKSMGMAHLNMLKLIAWANNSIQRLEIGGIKDSTVRCDLIEFFPAYGSKLVALDLCDLGTNLELTFFLKYCPHLDYLSVDSYLVWGDDLKPVISPKLHIALFEDITSQAAELFLQSATSLQAVFFRHIIGSELFLTTICKYSISKELVFFYIAEGELLNNAAHLSRFLVINPNIKRIGRVLFKHEDLGLGVDIDLKLLNL